MRKRLLIVAAILVALPLAAVIIAAISLPSERVARLVATRAEAKLGRELGIGDVGVSIFPLGISLEGLTVAGLAAADAPVVAVERFLLRPRLLPLLRGRVVVDELRLVGARIDIAIDSTGASNLPVPAADSAAAPATGSVSFDVREIRLERGAIVLNDARIGRAIRIDGIDQTLRLAGDLRAGRLESVRVGGRIRIDSLALRLPGDDDWTARGLRLALDHEARLFADSGVLHVDSLRVELQDVVLHGGGSVRGLSAVDSVRVLDLRLAAEPFDVARLIASLPARFTAALRDEEAALGGTAALAATVTGPMGVDTFPAIAGTLRLRDVSVARAGGQLLAGLTGDIDFANDSVATAGLTGSALGEPLRLSFGARRLADPIVSFEVDAALRLDALRSTGLLADSVPAMRGRVHARLAGEVQPSNADASHVAGTVLVERFATTTAKGQSLALDDARLTLAGDSVQLAPTRLVIAGQALTVGGTVSDWLPRALGDTTHLASARFDVRGTRFDLEPVLGPAPVPTFSQLVFARLANAPIEGRAAEDFAVERGAAPPSLPPLRATGTVRIDTMVSGGVAYTDVRATIESTPERLLVEQATFGMMGGRGDVAAVLTPSSSAGAPSGALVTGMHVLVQATMDDLDSDAFLTRFTSFRERAQGRLDLTGVVELMLDGRMLPVRETVQGRGMTTLRDGSLVGWPVMRALGERLGSTAFDTLRLREFTGGFDVAGPMVRFDDALLASSSGNARVAGSFGFDGRVDFGVEASIPAAIAARAGSALAGAVAQAADGTGDVPMGVRVAGAWRSPDVTPDFSRARANVANAAREAGRREGERLAEQGARALADRLGLGRADSASDSATARPAALPSVDSMGAALDSTRSDVENRVRDRIRDLF